MGRFHAGVPLDNFKEQTIFRSPGIGNVRSTTLPAGTVLSAAGRLRGVGPGPHAVTVAWSGERPKRVTRGSHCKALDSVWAVWGDGGGTRPPSVEGLGELGGKRLAEPRGAGAEAA